MDEILISYSLYSSDEAERLISEGGQYVGTLPNGKVVVKKVPSKTVLAGPWVTARTVVGTKPHFFQAQQHIACMNSAAYRTNQTTLRPKVLELLHCSQDHLSCFQACKIIIRHAYRLQYVVKILIGCFTSIAERGNTMFKVPVTSPSTMLPH